MRPRTIAPILILFIVMTWPIQLIGAMSSSQYSMKDLAPNVSGLLQSRAVDGYLVIGIVNTPDFIQIYGSDGIAYLDFPMIALRQKSMRPDIERICRELDLTVTVNKSANGAEFLDYELPRSAEQITVILIKLLKSVYGATDDSELELEANGFKLSKA